MKYFEEMLTKYGFGDGDAMPSEARTYREAYINVINAFAEKKGSAYRAVSYDRSGMHNSCLILFEKVDRSDWDVRYEDLDRQMQGAISDAHDFEVDAYITTKVRMNRLSLEADLLKYFRTNPEEKS